MSGDRPIDGLAKTASEWRQSGTPDFKLEGEAALYYVLAIGTILKAFEQHDLPELPDPGNVASAIAVRNKIRDDVHDPDVGILATFTKYKNYCNDMKDAILKGIANAQAADGGH
ncbi:MAG: hypothetical protein H6523_15075 [Mycolicibacterium sp.]|nr:hypothetical protein [Mycolicibacterium sp.]